MTSAAAMRLEEPTLHRVPVNGGELGVAVWHGEETPKGQDRHIVLAIHGLTMSHRTWSAIASQLPGVTVVAPDLRGRGLSSAVPGPYGMATHAEDLERVTSHFRAGRVLLLGHAMGGYVCERYAESHREQVTSMVLVDGGLTPEPPAGVNVQEYIETFLGPSLRRMQRTYESRDDYVDEWRRHPAFSETGVWNDAVENFVEHDLEQFGELFRCRTAEQSVRDDFADGRFGATTRSVAFALDDLPIRLLWAERGILNATPGLVTPELLSEYRLQLPQLTDTFLPGVNHYTITFAEPGISATRDAVLASLTATSSWLGA